MKKNQLKKWALAAVTTLLLTNMGKTQCCVGNLCGAAPNPLVGPWIVPMANFNYYFNDAINGGVGSVAIGDLNCANPITARLDVINTTTNKPIGVFVKHTIASAGPMTGMQTLATNTGGAGPVIGVSSTATATGVGPAGGVQGIALSAGANCTGIQGVAQGGATLAGTAATGAGGNATVNNSNLNIGLASVTRNGLTQSLGVRVNTIGSTSPNNQGLQVNLTGGVTAGSLNWGGLFTVSNTGGTNYGAQYIVSGATATNYGSTALVSGGASLNYGHYGQAQGATVVNYGMYGQATGATAGSNFGGYFIGDNASTNNYGVYASVSGFSNPVFPYGPDYAGFFDGDVVTTAGNILVSDRNLKKDIKGIEGSMEIIEKLHPVTYQFDLEQHKDLTLTDRKQFGFISQEVKEILPDLTAPVVFPATYDETGKEIRARQEYLGLNYDGFIAILTKGMQDQQQVIEEQKAQLAKQEERLSRLEKLLGQNPEDRAENVHSVDLTDKNTVVLNQNVPNPFAEQTVIAYNVPETAGFAQVLFYNAGGQLIKTVDITQKGTGKLSVFASDLSTGIYTYTLVIDGKVIDTKKMNKQ